MLWPNWTGKAVAIVASGPSVDRKAVAALEGRLTVLAIKHNHELAPFAQVIYGCDYPWWAMVRGLPAFPGLKLSYDPRDLAAVVLTHFHHDHTGGLDHFPHTRVIGPRENYAVSTGIKGMMMGCLPQRWPVSLK